MTYTVIPATVETTYAMESSYFLTSSFETGTQLYDDLEPFVRNAQSLLDDESI